VEVTVVALVAAAVATLVGAAIQSSIGFGMNLVTVPVLALVLPESLPVAVIVLGVPISVAMLRHEHASLDRAGLGWLLGGRVPGTALGVWVVAVVSTAALQAVVGGVVLAVVVASLVAPPIPVRPATQLTAGVVSGVTGTAAGIGGPPVALLYQRHEGPAIRSTLAVTFLVGTSLSLASLLLAGVVTGAQVALGVGLTPLVLLGAYVGRRSHATLDKGWLRPAVLAFAALSALVVIADAAL
jgi:uncharacterized membrane protein YfcA